MKLFEGNEFMEMQIAAAAEAANNVTEQDYLIRDRIVGAYGAIASSNLTTRNVRETALSSFTKTYGCDLRDFPHSASDPSSMEITSGNRTLIVRNVHAPYAGLVDNTITFQIFDNQGGQAQFAVVQYGDQHAFTQGNAAMRLGARFRLCSQSTVQTTLAEWLRDHGVGDMVLNAHKQVMQKKSRSMMMKLLAK